MKQLIIALILLVSVTSAEHTIQDNFKRAGLLIDGSGYFNPDRYNDGNPDLSWGIAPRFGFFFIDNFLISFSVSYSGETSQYTTEEYLDRYQVENDNGTYTEYYLYKKSKVKKKKHIWHFPLSTEWYFGHKNDSSKGFVHSVGVWGSLGVGVSSIENLDSADTPDYNPLFIPTYGFNYSLHYFITPTISPKISLHWQEVDLGVEQLIPQITLGFSYFIPTSKRVLIKAKKRDEDQ